MPQAPSMHPCMLPTQPDFLGNGYCTGTHIFTKAVYTNKDPRSNTELLKTDVPRESSAGLPRAVDIKQ